MMKFWKNLIFMMDKHMQVIFTELISAYCLILKYLYLNQARSIFINESWWCTLAAKRIATNYNYQYYLLYLYPIFLWITELNLANENLTLNLLLVWNLTITIPCIKCLVQIAVLAINSVDCWQQNEVFFWIL